MSGLGGDDDAERTSVSGEGSECEKTATLIWLAGPFEADVYGTSKGFIRVEVLWDDLLSALPSLTSGGLKMEFLLWQVFQLDADAFARTRFTAQSVPAPAKHASGGALSRHESHQSS